jgi:hypothetical protein
MDLPNGDRDEQDPDDHRERDDRPRPRQATGLVQPLEDVGEDVLERREYPADDHARAFRERPSGKTVWSCA